MFIARLMIRVRTTLTIIFVVLVLAVVGGLLYLNHQGLNEGIRNRISQELENHQLYVEFDSLKYSLTSGLMAENVTLYTDKTRSETIAKIPAIIVNLDKTKLLRGIQKLDSISLVDAHIELPLDLDNPNGARLILKQINGKIEFLEQSTIAIEKLTANYEGIELEITTNLWKERPINAKTIDPDAGKKRAAAYTKFLNHLKQWKWQEEHAPSLKIFAEGDLNSPQHIKIKFNLESPEVNFKQYKMREIILAGDLSHNLINIDEFYFKNHGKTAFFVGDYDLNHRSGSYHIDSNIHLKDFTSSIFAVDLLKGTHFGSSSIQADGHFQLARKRSDYPFAATLPSFLHAYPRARVQLIGTATLKDFRHLGSQFDSLSSDFSWNNGDLYLDKLNATSKDGTLKGRLLIKDQKIRYNVTSTLPLDAYKPFIPKTKKIEAQLAKLQCYEDSSYYFNSSGIINANDLTDLNASGSLSVTQISYDKKFKATSVTSSFDWKNKILKASLKLTGAEINTTKLNSITTDLAWGNNIFELKNFTVKDLDLSIGNLRTIIKQKDGKFACKLTLIDTKFKHLSFKQLDSNLGWQGGEDGHYGGLINISKPTFKNSALENILTNYQFTDDSFILPQLSIKHSSGSLTGKIEKKPDGYIYFDLLSTLHPHLYTALIKQVPIQNIILKGGFTDKSKHHITVNGRINPSNLKDWYASGSADLRRFSYNGVPLLSLKTNYWLDKTKFTTQKGALVFDYSNYTLRPNKRKGPASGWLNIDKVTVDHKLRTVTLKGIRGKAYPAPATRMFYPPAADHIEEYRFYSPPSITAAGVFDTMVRPPKDRKLDFYLNLTCPGSTTLYKFLDADHHLKDLSADIHILKNTVYVNQIKSTVFSGKLNGQFAITIPNQGDPAYSGNFNYNKISFAQLGAAHTFDEIPSGYLNGQIRFTGAGSHLKNFNATGNISLSKGNIFSVPVLGPISLILNPFLGKGTFNERLKNLSATYTITRGVLRTDNIRSLTPSMTFTGAGIVNLNNDQIDITIRINYRGLIGKTMQLGASVARLPFQVLRGLFLNKKPEIQGLLQIRGTGKYKDPKWRLVQFDIQRGFKGKLFNPPKAIIVDPNR